MSEYTLRDYFEHLGACDEGLEFVENSGASKLSGVLAEMDAEDGAELDFVAWTLEAICARILRSSDTGLEVRKLACLYAQTVIKNVQCAESAEFAEELQDIAKWTDPTLCDTADYIYQVKGNLMRVTDYEQGRVAIKDALTELSPEFDRVWGLVADWFDKNSPPTPVGEVVPVLEHMDACSESVAFFRGYRSAQDAFADLDPTDAQHRRWWFWIASTLCKATDDSSTMIDILEQLHECNLKNDKDLTTAREIGELIGALRAEGEVSRNSDEGFYNLRSYFNYDLVELFEATRSDLQRLWGDYVEQAGL